jgi:hypothetical protein
LKRGAVSEDVATTGRPDDRAAVLHGVEKLSDLASGFPPGRTIWPRLATVFHDRTITDPARATSSGPVSCPTSGVSLWAGSSA